MIWKKIKIKTLTEAADIVASVLYDNSVVGAEIEDNTNLTPEELAKMYVDIPIEKIDDGIAYVNFFVRVVSDEEKKNILDKKIDIDKSIIDDSYIASTDNIWTKDEFKDILNNIKADLEDYREFSNLGDLTFSEEEMDDNVFLNKWKENFKRLSIDNVEIIPNFDKDAIDDKKINIFIEPGSAFGTGQHETTKLCIKNILKIFNKKKRCK